LHHGGAADARRARSAVLVVLLALVALVLPLAVPGLGARALAAPLIPDDPSVNPVSSPFSQYLSEKVQSVGLPGIIQDAQDVDAHSDPAGSVNRADSINRMLELQTVSPTVVRPDDSVTVQVKVTNTSAKPIVDPVVSVELMNYRFSSRTMLARWSDEGIQTNLPVTVVTSQEVKDPIKPGESVTVRLRFEAADLHLIGGIDGWGPRGIAVKLAGTQNKTFEPALDVVRTYLLWYSAPDDTAPSLNISTAAILNGPAVNTLTEAQARATYLAAAAADSRLSHVLDAVAGAKHVSLVVDPAVVLGVQNAATSSPSTDDSAPAGDSEADSGQPNPSNSTNQTDSPGDGATTSTGDSTASNSATAGSAANTSSSSGSSAGTSDSADSPAVDPDSAPNATDQSGSPDSAFQPSAEQLRATQWLTIFSTTSTGRELFALPDFDADWNTYAQAGALMPEYSSAQKSANTSSASSAPSHTASANPFTGLTLSNTLAWPTANALSTGVIENAARSGRHWVIAEGDAATPTVTLPYTPDSAFTLETAAGSSRIMVAEPVLDELLAHPGTDNPISARQRFVAELAMIARERPSQLRNVLIALDRTWDPNPVVAAAQLEVIPSLPWLTTSDVAGLADSTIESAQSFAVPEAPSAAPLLDPTIFAELRTSVRKVEDLSSIAEDPAALVAPFRTAMRALTSTSWRSDVAGQRVAIGNLRSATKDALGAITVAAGSDINMISTGSEVPITVENNLNQDVSVKVRLRANDPRLQSKDTDTLTIPAGGSQSIRVPVTAVGSGNVVVSVDIYDAEGNFATTAGEFNVRVRADWENVGTGIVATLLVLLLGGGIWRTVKRGRSERRTTPTDTAATIALVEAEAEGGPSADTELKHVNPQYVADAENMAEAELEVVDPEPGSEKS